MGKKCIMKNMKQFVSLCKVTINCASLEGIIQTSLFKYKRVPWTKTSEKTFTDLAVFGMVFS